MLIMQITNLYAKYLIFLQNLVQVIKRNHPAGITCSNSIIETVEQYVKYVQS